MSGYYFLKGIGVGAAAGFALGIAVAPRKKSAKTRIGRAVRALMTDNG